MQIDGVIFDSSSPVWCQGAPWSPSNPGHFCADAYRGCSNAAYSLADSGCQYGNPFLCKVKSFP